MAAARVQVVSSEGEASKVAVRNIRRDVLKKADKLDLPEDDLKGVQDDVQVRVLCMLRSVCCACCARRNPVQRMARGMGACCDRLLGVLCVTACWDAAAGRQARVVAPAGGIACSAVSAAPWPSVRGLARVVPVLAVNSWDSAQSTAVSYDRLLAGGCCRWTEFRGILRRLAAPDSVCRPSLRRIDGRPVDASVCLRCRN